MNDLNIVIVFKLTLQKDTTMASTKLREKSL